MGCLRMAAILPQPGARHFGRVQSDAPMEWLSSPEAWIALVTLTLLEVVLGIDNVIFISIVAGKLPTADRARARRLGLTLAMLMRIGLLASIAWIARLTTPLVTLFGFEISGRDLILITGGLFLIGKATYEIHDKLEGEEGHASVRVPPSFGAVIVQILLLDIVFSLDSVITAIGMADDLAVMVLAVIIAVGVMLVFSGKISEFVEHHPTLKVLALSFLLLIGMSLVADGFHQHISKGYIYFAMGFSVFVEFVNLRIRARAVPVELRHRYQEEGK
jgi:predicted tellurium resistance membrane protein TerC